MRLLIRWAMIFFLLVMAIGGPAGAATSSSIRTSIAKTAFLSAASTAIIIPLQLSSPLAQCQWCNPNSFDRAVAQSWLWSNPNPARITSDVLLFGAAPALGLGTLALLHAADWNDTMLNTMAMGASVLVTMAFTNLTKKLALRQRPESYFGKHSYDRSDANLSFFSGHSSLASCVAAAASYLAFKRKPDAAPYLVTAGAIMATLTGYLRIAAGKHWATDVLAGIAMGSAIGILVPHWILTDNDERSLQIRFLPTIEEAGITAHLSW